MLTSTKSAACCRYPCSNAHRTWNLRLVYCPPGISWLYTSEEQDRRSLSKGAYSALVPCMQTPGDSLPAEHTVSPKGLNSVLSYSILSYQAGPEALKA